MGYQVNIRIGGLCLFYPETAADGSSAMNILMPRMPGAGEHAMHRHVPLLTFDAVHIGGELGREVHVPLQAVEVLAGVGRAVTSICPDVCNLYEIVKTTPMKKGVLTGYDSKKPLISARMKLSAGQMTGVMAGVCWKWKMDRQRLSNEIKWTIDVEDDAITTFDIVLNDLEEGSRDTLKLVPQPVITNRGKRNTIDLVIHHSPPNDLPPTPGPRVKPAFNSPAPHFEAFFSLFDDDELPISVPLFRSDGGVDPLASDGEGQCTVYSPQGGSPYTCMVAGVTP